ncbi:hypothetical protein [Pseudomonas sp. RIT-To-2]|uniref:hypothetical protein n=1 Tax=Pseudomonas sp. RIT-To-2 TaxID=3462541 RepID=UPI0024131CEB
MRADVSVLPLIPSAARAALLATAEVIYLVMGYPKRTKDSLTAVEKAELKALTQRLNNEV